MLARAGYGEATVHGTARASFKTWADEWTSFKDAVSEACLAHVEGNRVKAAYARGEFERQRAGLMEMWAQHCASLPADTAKQRRVTAERVIAYRPLQVAVRHVSYLLGLIIDDLAGLFAAYGVETPYDL
jgi:hypothetical protein